MALHELFGEAFAGLELCGGFAGPEDSPASFGEFIDHSELERDFGTYYGQVGSDLISERDE